MKLKPALIMATAVLLAAAPALADTTPSADALNAITANYKLACSVVLNPTDAAESKWFAFIAPDFTNTDLKGKTQSKDELTALIQQQLKVFHGTGCDSTTEAPTAPDANTVVITQTQKITGDFQGPDGGKHDVESTSKSQDTWKLTNGTWMLSSAKDLRELVKIDGTVQDDEGQ
jgi:hypothetical protein